MSSTNSGDEINESWQSLTEWSFDTPPAEEDSSYGDIVFNFDVIRTDRTRKMVGKYLVGGLLGRGSYSKVKELLDTQTLSRRAAKILKRRVLKRIPFGEQAANREISLLKSLAHENVVKLVDVLWRPHKEKVYVVLEYCPIVLQSRSFWTRRRRTSFPRIRRTTTSASWWRAWRTCTAAAWCTKTSSPATCCCLWRACSSCATSAWPRCCRCSAPATRAPPAGARPPSSLRRSPTARSASRASSWTCGAAG